MNDRRGGFLLIFGLVGSAAIGAEQQSGALAERTVGLDRGHAVSLTVPAPTGRAFQSDLVRLAIAAMTPIGLEIVADEPREARIVSVATRPQSRTLTSRSLGEALGFVASGGTGSRGAYAPKGVTWSEVDGVIHVSTVAGKTFLDTSVERYSVQDLDAWMVVRDIHRLFDDSYPEGHPNTLTGMILSSEPNAAAEMVASAQADLGRKISLELTHTTVRQILDALVKVHGRLMWCVRYDSADGAYAKSVIGFQTFSGTGGNLAARK